MTLPEQLEPIRERKVWVCYPMIYNATKHNGVGGYDKPPINPYTLFNGSTDKAESLATFDEAVAQIGKTAKVRVKGYDDIVETPVVGVGIAFGGTGICGIDLDNVTEKKNDGSGQYAVTDDALEMMKTLKTYTEISPSGNGIHLLFIGSLPKDVKKIAKPKLDVWDTMKAEYQLFDSGYMTVSGDVVGGKLRDDVDELVAQIYEKYFREVEPIRELSTKKPPTPARSPSVVSSGSGFTRERWLYEVSRLSDAELMKRIYASGSTGAKVKALYESGDLSVLVLHENIPNMISNITAAAAKEGINIENMVNKSKKDMSVTVMEMAELPSKHALETLAELQGIIRIRTFTRE